MKTYTLDQFKGLREGIILRHKPKYGPTLVLGGGRGPGALRVRPNMSRQPTTDQDGVFFDAGVKTVHFRRSLEMVAVPTLVPGSADDNRILLRVDTRSLGSLAVCDGKIAVRRGSPKTLVKSFGQRRLQEVTWEDSLVTMRVGDSIIVTYQDGATQVVTGTEDGPDLEVM